MREDLKIKRGYWDTCVSGERGDGVQKTKMRLMENEVIENRKVSSWVKIFL